MNADEDRQRFERHVNALMGGTGSYLGVIPDVYYASKRGLIKIGSSTYPDLRMDSLGGKLLATEPGGRHMEGFRLQQFAGSRVPGTTEWFFPDDALMAHIRELAAESDAPPVLLPAPVRRPSVRPPRPRSAPGYSSTQVSKLTGLTFRQINYWLEIGAITPSLFRGESSGRHHRWSSTDVERIQAIAQAMDDGLTLRAAVRRVDETTQQVAS